MLLAIAKRYIKWVGMDKYRYKDMNFYGVYVKFIKKVTDHLLLQFEHRREAHE